MKTSLFQEGAKLVASVVVTDFLLLLFVAQQKLLPSSVHGLTLATAIVLSGVLFDIGLLFILHRYITQSETISAQERQYLWFIGLMFLIVVWVHIVHVFLALGVVHLLEWTLAIVFLVYAGFSVKLYREMVRTFFARKIAEFTIVRKEQK